VGTASAIQGKDTGGNSDTPFEGMFSFLHQAQQPNFGFGAGGLSVPTPSSPTLASGRVVPIWIVTSLEYLMLIVIGYVLAIGGVRAPRHVFRSGRRRRRGQVQA
jgi:Flp pilus assembly protein TadB